MNTASPLTTARLPHKFPTDINPHHSGGPDFRAARFRLRSARASAPIRGVTRQRFRWMLIFMLIASSAFTVWSWTRPYEWNADPGARSIIVAAGLERDHSYHWLNLRLKVRPGVEHDLQLPVFLETASRPRVEPADTTLAGDVNRPIDEIFLRFWLEAGDLDGPVELHINEGTLSVRTGNGEPRMGRDGRAKNFNTRRW